MSSIDERVVEMKFNNGQFERGVKQTISSLESLKKGLSLEGAISGLKTLGSRLNLGGIADGVRNISSHFSVMGIAGVTALVNIANQAVQTGMQLAKSLTIDPIMQGLEEYETQLNSVQTILANTQADGTNLQDVNAALDELNLYADQTIYNFSEMTRSIGMFTAAGVDLETSTEAIKGISNLAAISGSNSQQASTAMYQLSQAISNGKVNLQDWNSVVNAGMGGEVFQNSLIETARVHGVAIDDIIKKNGSFRNSLQDGWLTDEILLETLSKFTGDLTAEQLEAMGYTEEQIAGILELGKTAQDAATKVKTVSQLIGTLREAAQSGWAGTWELIFGDFEEAKELFTNVNNVLGAMIEDSANARNAVVSGWKELGGRDVMIEALATAFEALMAIMKPIGDAFRQIFPPVTAETLYAMTVALRDFTQTLKIGEGTASKIQRTFAGFFAILSIGWQIVSAGLSMLFELFGVIQQGSGGFLEVTASIGDWLVALDASIKKGKVFERVFNVIGDALKVVLGALAIAGGAVVKFFQQIGNLFNGGGFDLSFFGDIGQALMDRFAPLAGVVEWVKEVGLKIGEVFVAIYDAIEPALSAIGEAVGGLGNTILDAIKTADFDTILDILNTGLFAGLLLLVKNFFGDFSSFFEGGGEGGIVETIKETFTGITDTLSAMQQSLKADTLIKIAAALGILTLSVIALSLIDSDALTKALTALTFMFTQLYISMDLFEKATTDTGFMKMPLVAASMILLGVAINILAIAVENLSDMDWEELAKGLTAVTVLLGALAGWSALMSKYSGSLIRASISMILVGAALKILANVTQDFAEMDWEELARGMTGVIGILGAVALFGNLGSGGTLKGALAIVLVGAALTILMGPLQKLSDMNPDKMVTAMVGLAASLAVLAGGMSLMTGTIAGAASMLIAVAALWILVPLLERLGEMSWNEIAKAATMLAGALVIIAGGMYLMTGIIAGAASMLVAVAALWILVPLLERLGEMSWEDIGQAATMLGAALLIIAGGMYLMTGALPGAAALIVVAAALAILTPVLLALSLLEWDSLLVALAALGGIFLVLGLAGLVLAPVVPVLILLGIAIGLLGLGALAAGAGMFLFATALTAIGAAAVVSGAALLQLFKDILAMIPYAMQQIGLGILALANVIANGGPTIVRALVTVLMSLITAINIVAPQIIETLNRMVHMLIDVLVENIPYFVEKGLEMINGILEGINSNIEEITTVALEIITNFIRGIENGIPELVDAGYDLIITFIESLADTIRANESRMNSAGADLADAIIDGMVSGIAGGAGRIASEARSAARGALNAAKDFLGIHSPSREFMKVGKYSDEGFAIGLKNYANVVGREATGVGSTAMDSLKKSVSNLSDVVSDDVNLNPTIRPVLDLSSVRKDAGQIGGLMGTPRIGADVSYGQAAGISASRNRSNETVSNDASSTGENSGVTFIQNNNSPSALSTIDIYRQTKNLISMAAGG